MDGYIHVGNSPEYNHMHHTTHHHHIKEAGGVAVEVVMEDIQVGEDVVMTVGGDVTTAVTILINYPPSSSSGVCCGEIMNLYLDSIEKKLFVVALEDDRLIVLNLYRKVNAGADVAENFILVERERESFLFRFGSFLEVNQWVIVLLNRFNCIYRLKCWSLEKLRELDFKIKCTNLYLNK